MTDEFIDKIFDEFTLSQINVFEEVTPIDRGMHFILYYLLKCEGETVFAGDLARTLKVSTARIAALLKKMEKREWIVRTPSTEDSRKVIVTITPSGTREINSCTQNMKKIISCLVEEIGEENLIKFFKISKQLKSTIAKVKNDKN